MSGSAGEAVGLEGAVARVWPWRGHCLCQAVVGSGPADATVAVLLDTTSKRKPSDGNPGPVLLVVVDGATLLEGCPCPLRDLLAGRSGGSMEC
ncbi:hypothetical protein ABZ370_33925 [Streptomyces sp. NPDC005962]|uniref:hypothetical protein n=1 Tax=Streptomyces sp. NPDC005962 TaxID=3154466 RepID=UPI0034015429